MPSFAYRSAPTLPPPPRVLDTTTTGVWLLQALCGIETLPGVLGLRPWVAAGGPPGPGEWIDTLTRAGVLVDNRSVHPTVASWVQALGAPDVALCATIRRDGGDLALVIARRDRLHVGAARHGDDVTLEQIDGVTGVRDIVERVLPLCGPGVPAVFDPMCLPFTALADANAKRVTGEPRPLSGLGLSAPQKRLLAAAADEATMTAGFVVVAHGRRGERIALMSASVIDTGLGRLVCGPTRGGDRTLRARIVPGTTSAAGRAVEAVVESIGVDWLRHRRDT